MDSWYSALRVPILDMLPGTTDDTRDTTREGGAQSSELFNIYRDYALYNSQRQSTRTRERTAYSALKRPEI